MKVWRRGLKMLLKCPRASRRPNELLTASSTMLLCWFRGLHHQSLRHTSLPSTLHPISQPSLPNRQRPPYLWLYPFSQHRIPNCYSNGRQRSSCRYFLRYLKTKVARFLEARDLKELAFQTTHTRSSIIFSSK